MFPVHIIVTKEMDRDKYPSPKVGYKAMKINYVPEEAGFYQSYRIGRCNLLGVPDYNVASMSDTISLNLSSRSFVWRIFSRRFFPSILTVFTAK